MMNALELTNAPYEDDAPMKGSARYPSLILFMFTKVTCSKGVKLVKEICLVIFALNTSCASVKERPLMTKIIGSAKV